MQPRRFIFTIFIPTFNRANTLNRALESVQDQTFRDFEVLIIDDGSTDGTPQLVQKWQEKVAFPIVYHWQHNQGKHVAHNTALNFARGKLTVILDSDDMLVPEALERLKRHWDLIPEGERDSFAGVEGLCAHMEDGRVAGTLYPDAPLVSDYIEIRKKYNVGGDKKNAVRTDLLKRFPFPQFPGEKHMRPSLLWKRLSIDYKFLYINEIVQLIEYQADGLSSDRFPLRVNNPHGFRFYYMEETNLNASRYGLFERFRNCTRYVRYSFHAGIPIRQQFEDVDRVFLWCISLFPGYIDWLRDRRRILKLGLTRTIKS